MEIKKIAVDLPYPNTDGIGEDLYSAYIIAPAYAGLHGELTAILQYIYHEHYFSAAKEEADAELLEGIAIAEMDHLDILGKLLLELGVDPVYTQMPLRRGNYYNSSEVSTSNTRKTMLLDDIKAEMLAIESYEKMVKCLKNERVIEIIQRIILDEKLHLKLFSEAYKAS